MVVCFIPLVHHSLERLLLLPSVTTTCLSVCDHFVGLGLKGLKLSNWEAFKLSPSPLGFELEGATIC